MPLENCFDVGERPSSFCFDATGNELGAGSVGAHLPRNVEQVADANCGGKGERRLHRKWVVRDFRRVAG
jgi:hypothetical protein